MRTPQRTGAGERIDAAGGALVALAALCFGVIVVLGKLALRAGLPVVSALAFRFMLAAAVLGPMLAGLGRPLVAAHRERLRLVAVGALGYGVEASFFFAALRHGTAAAVTLLFFTYPILVTLVAWALGRGRPRRLTVAALASATMGAAVLVASGSGLSIEPIGAAMALGSAVMYTAYLLSVSRLMRRTDAMTGAMWIAGSAGLGLAAGAAATGTLQVPSAWSQWLPVLGMAAATALAFFCLLEGLRRIGPVRTSIISAGEPLGAAVLAAIFLGEAVSLGTAVGGALILVGAVAAGLARAVTPTEPPIP